MVGKQKQYSRVQLWVLCYHLKDRKNWSLSKPLVWSSFHLSLVHWVLSVFTVKKSRIETHVSSFYSIAACKAKPLVSRVHPPGICLNWFLYLLPIIFFRDLQRPWLRFRWLLWGWQYLNRLWRHFKSLHSLITTRNFKMGDNFSLVTDSLLARHAIGKERVTKL